MYYIDKTELKELIREVIRDEEKTQITQEIYDYEIMRLGHLALGYKTFIGREATRDDIEIYEWSEDYTSRWTVASFEYDEDEEVYTLVSCGDRLSRIDDWEAFGILVQTGYDILNHLI